MALADPEDGPVPRRAKGWGSKVLMRQTDLGSRWATKTSKIDRISANCLSCLLIDGRPTVPYDLIGKPLKAYRRRRRRKTK